jgi:hypothetical protein
VRERVRERESERVREREREREKERERERERERDRERKREKEERERGATLMFLLLAASFHPIVVCERFAQTTKSPPNHTKFPPTLWRKLTQPPPRFFQDTSNALQEDHCKHNRLSYFSKNSCMAQTRHRRAPLREKKMCLLISFT